LTPHAKAVSHTFRQHRVTDHATYIKRQVIDSRRAKAKVGVLMASGLHPEGIGRIDPIGSGNPNRINPGRT